MVGPSGLWESTHVGGTETRVSVERGLFVSRVHTMRRELRDRGLPDMRGVGSTAGRGSRRGAVQYSMVFALA